MTPLGLGKWIGRGDEHPPYYHVDRVTPWLLIGPALTPEDYRVLVRDHRVSHIVDLREEAADDPTLMESLNVFWRRLPIPDRHAPTVAQVDDLVEWLDRHSAADEALYLHCEGGLGRTPTIAIALLMRHGLSLPEAHGIVQTARAEANPTPAQLAWLEALPAAD